MATLTILGVCDPGKRGRMEEVVAKEAAKIPFLHPETSVAEIKTKQTDWWNAFNHFCVADMYSAFTTDFVLIVQFDGRILNPGGWSGDFWNYDYVGSPWGDRVCGNGGFSLRSRKFCQWVSENLTGVWERNFAGRGILANEDRFLCRSMRQKLEAAGFRFAPIEVAERFGTEGGVFNGQFGAHHWVTTSGRRYDLKALDENGFEELFRKTNSKNALIDQCTVVVATVRKHELVTHMAMSLEKSAGKLPQVIVLNNGDSIHTCDFRKGRFLEVDNRGSRLTPLMPKARGEPSDRHCSSIDYALKNLVKTKYAVVVDNDTLFKPKCSEIFNATPDYDAAGEFRKCGGDRDPRLLPMFCVIDVDKMQSDGISYYDYNRCWATHPYCWDTGGSFKADIVNAGWNIRQFKIDDYIVHLSGAELYNQRVEDFINKHSGLWKL